MRKLLIPCLLLALSAALMSGCKPAATDPAAQPANTNAGAAKSATPPTKPDADGVIASGTGTE